VNESGRGSIDAEVNSVQGPVAAFPAVEELAMKTTAKRARRARGAVFATSAVGGVLVCALTGPGTPAATAAQDPCAASQVARTVGSVATSMGYYLDSHPETNQALTTISQQQQGPQSLASLKTYFDANPQVAKDMQALQSPLMVLSSGCSLPLTLPQVLGLMQSAQGQAGGGVPGGLPGAQSTAQTSTLPGAVGPVQSTAAPSAARGPGPLPGPYAATVG
jgi:heme-binding protein